MTETRDMHGKTIVITGASSGIGAAATGALTRLGATVIAVGRSRDKTERVAALTGATPLVADFADLDSVRELAAQLLQLCPRIDVLAHNAGATVPERVTTVDGHELTLQTNYLAPFLLHHLLQERVLATGAARVIATSSLGHRLGTIDLDDLEWTNRTYRAPLVYGTAKLANILFVRELSRRTADRDVSATAFHPGVVGSDFGSDARGPVGWFYRSAIGRRLTISPEQGAAPLVHLATTSDAENNDGLYFDKLARGASTSRQARDPQLARQLWTATESMLNLS